MTEEEKKTLIDAVNCKYPHQNLTEIYYNIGRALPFTAQRFPDGRVSDWYRNQYVEVVRVEPHGRGGKFGNVFGFYYRNGERADAYENDVSIRPTTGIKPLYTTIATVTINSISRYCFVEPICYSLYQLQDSSFCLVSTHSGCFNFHLCGSRFKSSSWVAFL